MYTVEDKTIAIVWIAFYEEVPIKFLEKIIILSWDFHLVLTLAEIILEIETICLLRIQAVGSTKGAHFEETVKIMTNHFPNGF